MGVVMRELMQPITGTMLRPCGRRALYWHRGQCLGYGQKFGVQFARSGALIVSLYRCGTVMIYKVMHPITGSILTMLPRETTGDDAARYAVGGKTPGFPGFALLASERRLREEGERGGREGGGVLGLNPTPSRSTRLDRIENFPINFFPKK